jgi:hypothetical protein
LCEAVEYIQNQRDFDLATCAIAGVVIMEYLRKIRLRRFSYRLFVDLVKEDFHAAVVNGILRQTNLPDESEEYLLKRVVS